MSQIARVTGLSADGTALRCVIQHYDPETRSFVDSRYGGREIEAHNLPGPLSVAPVGRLIVVHTAPVDDGPGMPKAGAAQAPWPYVCEV